MFGAPAVVATTRGNSSSVVQTLSAASTPADRIRASTPGRSAASSGNARWQCESTNIAVRARFELRKLQGERRKLQRVGRTSRFQRATEGVLDTLAGGHP